jgi:hypothetical protein
MYSLVDAINVVLGFNSNAAVARDELVLACDALSVLEFALSIVPIARVQHYSILVGRQLSLDAAVCA